MLLYTRHSKTLYKLCFSLNILLLFLLSVYRIVFYSFEKGCFFSRGSKKASRIPFNSIDSKFICVCLFISIFVALDREQIKWTFFGIFWNRYRYKQYTVQRAHMCTNLSSFILFDKSNKLTWLLISSEHFHQLMFMTK